VGLDENASRFLAATGASRNLRDLLEAALGGAQVAALKGRDPRRPRPPA
jgi:hypothetical protein